MHLTQNNRRIGWLNDFWTDYMKKPMCNYCYIWLVQEQYYTRGYHIGVEDRMVISPSLKVSCPPTVIRDVFHSTTCTWGAYHCSTAMNTVEQLLTIKASVCFFTQITPSLFVWITKCSTCNVLEKSESHIFYIMTVELVRSMIWVWWLTGLSWTGSVPVGVNCCWHIKSFSVSFVKILTLSLQLQSLPVILIKIF